MPSKRIFIISLVILCSVGYFWIGSRYPELNQKSAMGGSLPLEDSINFESLLEISSQTPPWKRVLYSSLNWVNTNRKGMTFAFWIGACFLTLFGLLPRFQIRNRHLASFFGALLGAPLGVCVNCAAPISASLLRAGIRSEMALATLFASPTLNSVVLVMLFSLFPLHLALLKIGLTLVFILLFIPFLSRKLAPPTVAPSSKNQPSFECESWATAAWETARQFTKNLWVIVKLTGPLMIMAAVLGAALTHLLPLDSLFPPGVSWKRIVALAALGLLLPVPMALDLVLAQALWIAGVHEAYVMTVLFSFGIYSFYAGAIIWKVISPKLAVSCFGSLFFLTVGAAYLAIPFQKNAWDKMLIQYEAGKRQFAAVPSKLPSEGLSKETTELAPSPLPLQTRFNSATILLRSFAHRARNKKGDLPFTRMEGPSLGLTIPNSFGPFDAFTPFLDGRGIATGDFDRDGWIDILVGTPTGPALFQNQGGTHFIQRREPAFENLTQTFVVAFVDMNNDGWLDIFVTTFGGKNYLLISSKGRFQKTHIINAPSTLALLTNAVAFGDLDQDGDLDFIYGNAHLDLVHEMPSSLATNQIFRNSKLEFEPLPVQETPAHTHSVLLSDYFADGLLDLTIGNDYDPPDLFYKGMADAQFSLKSEAFPHTPLMTMSVDSADINNDLRLDLYVGQVSGTFSYQKFPHIENEDYCRSIENSKARVRCEEALPLRKILNYWSINSESLGRCATLQDSLQRLPCMSMAALMVGIRQRKEEICSHIPNTHTIAKTLCHAYFKEIARSNGTPSKEGLPQIKKKNSLFMAQPNNSFIDVASTWGAEDTGWTWNAKFADLDNDGWQDLYAGNGFWLLRKDGSNAFLKNHQGTRFERMEREFGLEDHMVVPSYSYADLDRDGDLDLITYPINSPLKVFWNNNLRNHSITLSLVDLHQNRFGVGAKIFIFYGDNKSQVREIKASGGFHSFDPLEAHFGLGQEDHIDRIEVQRFGKTVVVARNLPADHHYQITLKPPQLAFR